MLINPTHNDLNITPAGLVVYHKNACFGASPDSFVECNCYKAGVMEVKCLFTAKDLSISKFVAVHIILSRVHNI